MFLLAHLAKIQGLKGEFLLHAVMDEPERLEQIQGLVLAPPDMDLAHACEASAPARIVHLKSFRWHQDRACVAFKEFADRTAIEPFKGWALWMPEDQANLEEGESYRHDWIGCEVFIHDVRVGEVLRLEPTPGGYDMVLMRDLRPGRTGLREIPYIKAWFLNVDLKQRRIDVDPPEGLLDIDRLS
jgi:16S rRNA processing protein RimM